METKNLNKWISKQRKKNLMKSTKIDILDVSNWIIDKKKIYNKSKSFFSIFPFMFQYKKKKKWFQPLIIQKEIGILGILKKKTKIQRLLSFTGKSRARKQ